jgi:hypothetical protein
MHPIMFCSVLSIGDCHNTELESWSGRWCKGMYYVQVCCNYVMYAIVKNGFNPRVFCLSVYAYCLMFVEQNVEIIQRILMPSFMTWFY